MFADVLSRPLETVSDINTLFISPPSYKIPLLLKQAHDKAGHLSLRYNLDFLQPLYSWPNIKQDVNQYIKSCVVCSKTNAFRPINTQRPCND